MADMMGIGGKIAMADMMAIGGRIAMAYMVESIIMVDKLYCYLEPNYKHETFKLFFS
jgi:hypothetical protein